MKNDNDRIVSMPTSLRTNLLYAIFYKRQMRIIRKGFTIGISGLPVLLDNLKYYSKYTKLFYIYLLKEMEITTCVYIFYLSNHHSS